MKVPFSIHQSVCRGAVGKAPPRLTTPLAASIAFPTPSLAAAIAIAPRHRCCRRRSPVSQRYREDLPRGRRGRQDASSGPRWAGQPR